MLHALLHAADAVATKAPAKIGEPWLNITIFGLFVAVPAVWAYNYFAGKVEGFNVEMDNSSSELLDYFIKKGA